MTTEILTRVTRMQLGANTPIHVPPSEALRTKKLIHAFRQIEAPLEGEQPVYRIADVGAGSGVFAAFAALRWPYAYLDCFLTEGEDARRCCTMNAQALTRFIVLDASKVDELKPDYDGLHIGRGDARVSFDDEVLAKLRVVFAEWENPETLAQLLEVFGAEGMRLEQIGSFGPGEGWAYWVKPKGAEQ